MKVLLNKAMQLLAQRDHSEYELRRKLTTQSSFAKKHISTDPDKENNLVDHDKLEQVIQYCYANRWLDDHEYARKFVRMRSEKGYGSQRIKLELQQRGISRDIVYTVLTETEIDWCGIADRLVFRRFGDVSSLDWTEKAKVQRFLAYRGFFQEEIHIIFERNFD